MKRTENCTQDPHCTSLNHFSITVESIKERENRLVKKSSSVWETQVSVVALVRSDGFTHAVYDQMTVLQHITYGTLE